VDQVEIYVMSAGYEAHQDYRWRVVREDELAEAGDALDALEALQRQVDSHKNVTAILERVDDGLRLLISGIHTARTDWISRPITVDLALFGPSDPAVERVLRGTLASMLADPAAFAEAIGRLAAFDESNIGWAVKGPDFAQWIETQADLAATDASPADSAGQMAPYDTENAQKLAHELRAHQIPTRTGVLVIAADYHDADSLVRLQVWRGLSTIIGTPGPIVLPEADNDRTNSSGKYRRTLIAVAVVGIAAIGVILLLKLT